MFFLADEMISCTYVSAVVFSMSPCAPEEFQCHSRQDGCIPLEKSCDAWIDCMRDGSDESPQECNEGSVYLL